MSKKIEDWRRIIDAVDVELTRLLNKRTKCALEIGKIKATEAQIQAVLDKLISHDFDVHRSTGVERTVLGVVGSRKPDPGEYMRLEGVKEVIRISKDK